MTTNLTQAISLAYEKKRTKYQAICLRITQDVDLANDAVQDGFVQMLNAAHQFDPEKGTIEQWSTTIVKHAALRLRRDHLRRNICDDMSNVTTSIDPYEKLEHWECKKYVSALPQRQSQALEMHDYFGFKHEEISQMLGISVGASKSNLFKARRNFKRMVA